jgi:hypothetical protein
MKNQEAKRKTRDEMLLINRVEMNACNLQEVNTYMIV